MCAWGICMGLGGLIYVYNYRGETVSNRIDLTILSDQATILNMCRGAGKTFRGGAKKFSKMINWAKVFLM